MSNSDLLALCLILSASKYFSMISLSFYICRGCTDICKTIFVILEVQFHHEGCLSGSRYFELLFSGWSIFLPCKNSASSDTLFKLFWTFTLILAKLSNKKCDEKFLVQNLGRNHLKKCNYFCLVGLLNEKRVSTFVHFLYFSKPHWPS